MIPSWLTEEAWQKMPAWERALHLASSMERKKVREEAGANRGYWVDRFLAVVGLGPGYAWCAAFVSWCLVQGGVDRKKLPKGAAAVRNWSAWADATGRYRNLEEGPIRGDLMFWVDRSGLGHIGFVVDVSAWASQGLVTTIEGNTNAAGGREGDGVHRRTRTKHELSHRHRSGFISLRDL